MTEPAARPDQGPDSQWAAALARGSFMIQRCAACGTAQWPVALVCRACGAPGPAMVPASGAGTVHATTTVRDREGDYNVSLIDLAEGPRLMSRVEGVGPEAVRIGMPVTARVVSGETPLLVFHPVPEATP